jgi:Tfp pilus tip-associated adhesin PilY1
MQTPGAPLLTITLNSQLSTVTVSWPSSATNYVLQQNSNLTNTANWVNTGLLITTNGTTESVTISPPAGNLFFRLKQ